MFVDFTDKEFTMTVPWQGPLLGVYDIGNGGMMKKDTKNPNYILLIFFLERV